MSKNDQNESAKLTAVFHSITDEVRKKAVSFFSKISEWLETSNISYFQAVDRNNLSHLKNLLEANDKNINIQEIDNGETLLMAAVNQNNKEIVDFLLAKGASVNIQNDKGETALFYAVKQDCLDIANALLAAGAQTDIENKKGYTPVMCALKSNSSKMIALLAMYDPKLMEISGAGYKKLSKPAYEETTKKTYALINAVLSQNEKRLKKLIDEKADVNAADQTGMTPLMFAVQTHQIRAVEMLIRAGADVQKRNCCGNRAIDFIIPYLPWSEQEKMVKVLLQPMQKEIHAKVNNAVKVTKHASLGAKTKKQNEHQKA